MKPQTPVTIGLVRPRPPASFTGGALLVAGGMASVTGVSATGPVAVVGGGASASAIGDSVTRAWMARVFSSWDWGVFGVSAGIGTTIRWRRRTTQRMLTEPPPTGSGMGEVAAFGLEPGVTGQLGIALELTACGFRRDGDDADTPSPRRQRASEGHVNTTTFDAARADYRTWLRWFFIGIPLLFTVVAALAWRETEAGGGPQWLVFVVGLPLVAAWVLWRTRDAAVTVTPAGRLRRRSVTGDQAAELSRMAEVMVLPSLSYEDQLGAVNNHRQPYGYRVRDLDGREVAIARGLPWTDTAPVLAQVARALGAGQGRCDPLTWEVLYRDAGLAPAPFPDRLTRPPEDGWGTPLRILRKQRASTLTPLFALTGTPLVGAVAGFFGMLSDHPGRALTALAGGLLTTGVFWALLWQVIRRGDRDQVTIVEDGRLHAVTRRTRFLTLGYRIDEGAVDLTMLTRVQVVPGSYTHESKRDQPQWWRLELEDDTAAAAINLMHPRTPRATLFPQLAWHLERSDVELDAVTRRAIDLRLGRPLGSVPAR